MLSLLTNTSASVAQRNLGQTNAKISGSLEKLSSGLRVNKASDDVASMAIGSRLNSELTALRTVATNAGQAVSLLQIAEGVYSRVNDMLVRMKSLSAQAANGTLSDTERQLLDVEFQALKNEIDRVADDTTFNGTALTNTQESLSGGTVPGTVLNMVGFNMGSTALVAGSNIDMVYTANGGDAGGVFTVTDTVNGVTYTGTLDAALVDTDNTLLKDTGIQLQGNNGESSITIVLDTTFAANATIATFVDNLLYTANDSVQTFNFRVGSGSNSSEDVITASIAGIDTTNFAFDDVDGAGADINITDVDNADLASQLVDAAINAVIGARAGVGATQNRIETARTNLATTIENTEAAKSSYLDSDVASEITKFTSQQILLQSGISTLAQANQIPQNLLSLFQ